MNSTNHVGRLTRDPELRSTNGGTPVCNMRIAVDGRNDRTDYFDVTAWGKLAELCAEHLSKGRLVSVIGRLQSGEYTAQDGSKRYTVEIVAHEIGFLGAKPEADDESEPSSDEPVAAGVGADDDIQF